MRLLLMKVRVAVSVNVMRGDDDDEVPFESCPFPWQTFDANVVNAKIVPVLASHPINSINSMHSQLTCSSCGTDSLSPLKCPTMSRSPSRVSSFVYDSWLFDFGTVKEREKKLIKILSF